MTKRKVKTKKLTKKVLHLAAQAMGRKGGLKGGPARAAKMTPEERSESARKAINARWAKYYNDKQQPPSSTRGSERRK